ncbi:PilW family protein [Pseudomonas sp. 2FE]|uniref:PilW family protein n=1 Tax=Pseudomonas sp. 2FE TaxID=2502190 RepID=UPI0021139B88|nr:PilW family protein [Pseudomonas sp. 2FE]
MTDLNSMPRTSNKPVRGAQSGFSLIELMVSVTISLLIMAAILTLYLDISRNNNEMAKTNAQIENGRFAIQLMANDLAHGGFWDGYIPEFDDLTLTTAPADVPNAVPAPCQAYTSWTAVDKANLLGIPVQAYDAAPSGCTSVVTNKKANTDVLLVRHAENCVANGDNCEASASGKLYFQVSLCADDSAPYVLGKNGFTLHQRATPAGLTSCADPASPNFSDIRKFISNMYYIRDYSVTAGDGIPTLMRSQFDLKDGELKHQTAEPLIEGVEGFRVELGIDSLSDSGAAVNYTQAVNWADANNKTSPTNRGDGAPDGVFVRCTTAAPCTAVQLTNTVAVKLYVLVRSLETTPGYTDSKAYRLGSITLGPFNDGYKRHVFSTTVRLTNISGRRETP